MRLEPPSSVPSAANALLHYFAGRAADPRAAIRRGYAAYRAFYDVLPPTYEACEPLLDPGAERGENPDGRFEQ